MAKARLIGPRTKAAKRLADFVGSGRESAHLSAAYKTALTASLAKKTRPAKKS
jgi:hypothetical protein